MGAAFVCLSYETTEDSVVRFIHKKGYDGDILNGLNVDIREDNERK